MAERGIVRRILAIFDRDSAKKVETQLEESLGKAGQKGGENFARELRKQFDTKIADLRVKMAKGIIDEKEFRRQSELAAKEFNAGIVKGMEQARAAGTLTEKEYLKLSRTLKKVGQDGETVFTRMKAAAIRAGAAMLAAFSVRAVVRFGVESVKAAAEAEAAWKNLEGAVESTGTAFEDAEPKIRAAAEQFERLTTFDDDAYAETLRRLISITGDFEASLQNVLLVADVAARFFEGDLKRAADLVGRAMLGDVEMLQRLGIQAKGAQEALDILAERSFGAAADRASTFAGKLEQLNTQWGNFKEAVGDAIVGAGGSTRAIDVLIAVVRALTGWVTENAAAIGHLGLMLRWLTEHVIARTLSLALLPLVTALALLAKGYGLAAESAAVFGRLLGQDTTGIDAHVKKVNELSEALAKLAIQLGKTVITGGTIPEPPAPADVDRDRTPPAVADDAKTDDVVDKQKKAAGEVETVWGGAMKRIEEEANEQRAVLDELGEAWKRGGFAALAALAKEKVKENLAAALEMAAKALGALFFGNAPAAAAAAKASAMHVVAAGAWRAMAGGGGGGGGSAGTAAGGGLAAGSATGLQRADETRPPGTEVHIHMDPIDPRDVRYQEITKETNRIVEERFGENATVTWHPRTGR